jgi:hypothetical protein
VVPEEVLQAVVAGRRRWSRRGFSPEAQRWSCPS